MKNHFCQKVPLVLHLLETNERTIISEIKYFLICTYHREENDFKGAFLGKTSLSDLLSTISILWNIFGVLKTQNSTLCIYVLKDPDSPGFDPRTRAFSEEELRPQPILRKRKKQYVSDEMKNEQYWQKRIKNNTAARKSREAKRLRENQVSFLTIKGDKPSNLNSVSMFFSISTSDNGHPGSWILD